MKDKAIINVDGRIIEATAGEMLLEVLNEYGIYVPQLCNHPSLPPNGACRLCMVEVSKKGSKSEKTVASCLYPVEEGLNVKTRTNEILTIRRTLLKLYLAQSPASESIKDLARIEGIDTTPYTADDPDNRCVMCGLCTRACLDYGPGAISTLGRGIDKHIGPNMTEIAEDCTGCKSCTYVCPTDAIPYKQESEQLSIWGKNFKIPICKVNPELCRACGICEESCPFSIPRVTLTEKGSLFSTISATSCVGCGICAGSCPTGAITQEKSDALTDLENLFSNNNLEGKSIVLCCPRSSIIHESDSVIKVSCIGNVHISSMMLLIASGADSVSLLCRDALSCPYHSGCLQAENRIMQVKNILTYLGLEEERVCLLDSLPGYDGAEKAWTSYLEKLPERQVLLKDPFIKPGRTNSGLDLALDIINWLKERSELDIKMPLKLVRSMEMKSSSKVALYLGSLPELLILTEQMVCREAENVILSGIKHFLADRDIEVNFVNSIKELQNSNYELIINATTQDIRSELKNVAVKNLFELVNEDNLPCEAPFTFYLSRDQKTTLFEALINCTNGLSSVTPEQYLQYSLLLRSGSWQSTLKSFDNLLFIPYHDSLKSKNTLESSENKFRIAQHPILPSLPTASIPFTFNKESYYARPGEVISSALYASGITIFGHHEKDGGAQGIYCVNGQCSQCMVIADGVPVKSCMTPVTANMKVESMEKAPYLVDDAKTATIKPADDVLNTDVLIIGGGPAGICAAIELGNVGVSVLLVDDKQELGGKLSLQTHNFFGSVKDCYAGSRGVHIGHILADELMRLPSVKTWLNSTVIGVFSDGVFGITRNGVYTVVKAERILFSTGAREKSLPFPGCDLPGVYGAGAFQTLVNRDLVKCANKLFIIGGGNVGLIGAYHALQAGIDVVGLVEALPRCGGYKVHEDKIRRLGVPIWTRHTVLRIEGNEKVERVITAAIDDKFKPIEGTEKVFEVDTVLIAVGLSPVDELLHKAKEYGLNVYSAGDANEIAEASAAIFSGKITGRRIAQDIGIDLPVPSHWEDFGDILKHKPGEAVEFLPEDLETPVYPLIRCMQEIPCNPCTQVCPNDCIKMTGSILALPRYDGECIACGKCVLACPGLAITVVVNDYDPKKQKALLMLPFEFNNKDIPVGSEVTTTDMEGNIVGKGKVLAYKDRENQNKRRLLYLEIPHEHKLKVAGFLIRDIFEGSHVAQVAAENDPMICRCERVRKSDIVREIRSGTRDMNQLKASVRAGLGGCNGKTCTELILRIFREEGVPLEEVEMPTHRPLVAEVHLGNFLSPSGEDNDDEK